jgi:hypothetical protein
MGHNLCRYATGAIEILSDVVVVKEGEKVTSSAAALLAKLGFTPFTYGLETLMVGAPYKLRIQQRTRTVKAPGFSTLERVK